MKPAPTGLLHRVVAIETNMHELPEGLSHSLRSFRGSIYGNNARHSRSDRDLEKGPEDYGEKAQDGGLASPAESSMILVCPGPYRRDRWISAVGTELM